MSLRLLAIETATEACSVALWIDGEVRERHALAPRRHAELVLPWAEALLAEAGLAASALDAIAVGRGPGAFTGVRLAISLGQGLAFGLERPMLGVSTLAVLAQGGAGARRVAAIDARMGEVYLGAFALGEDGLVRPEGPERLGPPDAVALPPAGEGWSARGTGFAAAGGVLASRLGVASGEAGGDALPRAADLARLAAAAFARGEAVAPEQVEPAYLRDKVALTLAEQHAARGG
jgi:tRNA threonylcarbamoyladenosine biosynthesis protein TsaB